MRDLEYYRNSGGGVTLSGGECATFPEYLNRLLKNLKKADIHIVIETAGDFYYEEFKSLVVPYVDLIYYDIKFANNEFHEKYCGRPNTRILQNLFDLFKDGQVKVQPRIPLIPGITDTRQNLSKISSLLRDHGQTEVWILPYNPAGLAKYETLGRPIPELPSNFMRPKDLDKAREIISGKSPVSQTLS
jgi:pyruvate formate lyase activating enzyme